MPLVGKRIIRAVRVLLQVALMVLVGVVSYLVGRHHADKRASPITPLRDTLSVTHHHPNHPGPVHVPNTPGDACRILMKCFNEDGSIYEDLPTCHNNMKLILKYYHNTALFDAGLLVGFSSFHYETAPSGAKAISIYNVCVDPAYRQRGLAKRMLAEGVEEMRAYQKITGDKLLLALDVDLSTEMAAESFALYAKMGFLRGWQPCRSVADVDWRPVIEDPGNQMTKSPMAEILGSPKKYLEDEVMGGKPGLRLKPRGYSKEPINHFCMFRFYEEDWLTMGKYLAKPHQPKPSTSSNVTSTKEAVG